jgi:hypothetical protein
MNPTFLLRASLVISLPPNWQRRAGRMTTTPMIVKFALDLAVKRARARAYTSFVVVPNPGSCLIEKSRNSDAHLGSEGMASLAHEWISEPLGLQVAPLDCDGRRKAKKELCSVDRQRG